MSYRAVARSFRPPIDRAGKLRDRKANARGNGGGEPSTLAFAFRSLRFQPLPLLHCLLTVRLVYSGGRDSASFAGRMVQMVRVSPEGIVREAGGVLRGLGGLGRLGGAIPRHRCPRTVGRLGRSFLVPRFEGAER